MEHRKRMRRLNCKDEAFRVTKMKRERRENGFFANKDVVTKAGMLKKKMGINAKKTIPREK